MSSMKVEDKQASVISVDSMKCLLYVALLDIQTTAGSYWKSFDIDALL